MNGLEWHSCAWVLALWCACACAGEALNLMMTAVGKVVLSLQRDRTSFRQALGHYQQQSKRGSAGRLSPIVEGGAPPSAAPQNLTSSQLLLPASEVRTVELERGPSGYGFQFVADKELESAVRVTLVKPNSPAAASQQIFVGDRIVAINGMDTRAMCNGGASNLMATRTPTPFARSCGGKG